MTTTNTFQGLQGDRSTSRVLRPPGGASSNIFGGDDANANQAPQKAAQGAGAQEPEVAPRDQAAASRKASQQSSIFGDSDVAEQPKDAAKQQEMPPQEIGESKDSYSAAQAQAAASKKANDAGSNIFGGPIPPEESPRVAPEQEPSEPVASESETAEVIHAVAQATAAAAKKANYEGSNIFGGPLPPSEVKSPRKQTEEAPVANDTQSEEMYSSAQKQAAAAKKANYEGSNIFGGPLPPQPAQSTSPRHETKSPSQTEVCAESVDLHASAQAQAAAAKKANYAGSNIFGSSAPASAPASAPVSEPVKPQSPPSPSKPDVDGVDNQRTARTASAAAAKKANYEGSDIFGGPLPPNSARSPRSEDSLSQAQAQAQASKRANYEGSNIFGGPTSPAEGRTSGKQQQQQQQQSGGFNPITGQAYNANNQGSNPATRARQPPGGASQGLW